MTAPTYNKTRPAARFVERIAMDPADEQWLKEVLGLVTPEGELAPDDDNVYNFPPPSKGPGDKNPRTSPTRDRSAVPEGLRDLTPTEEQDPPKKRRGPKPKPKVIRPSKPREIPACGTYKAFARHKRRGEEVDQACLDVSREYSRNYSRERTARLKREAEAQRLREAGVQDEAAIELLSGLAR